MAENTSSTGSSWWQTLPGILTGLAAIVTAVTGLFIAFNHTSSRGEPAPSTASSAPPSPSASAASPAASAGASPPSGSVPLPALHQVKPAGGNAVITILSAQIEPVDAERRSLKFGVRYMNAGRYPANFWSDSYRLIVDDVPRAPVKLLDEVVAGDTAKEGEVVFELPVSVKDVVLQISSGDEKSRLPFKLP
jgi:hypothetical protein